VSRIKRIGRETAYEGNIITLYNDYMVNDEGVEATWDFINHPGAAAVVAINDEGKILFVRQYRNSVDDLTLEIPAGKLDAPDEDPLLCATRELSEETGYQAENITKLTTVATTVGFSNEYIHIYAATGLTAGKQHTDEDEFINVVKMPLSQAVELVTKGEIYDAKSVAAILLLERSQKENANV
jgi:ADP-ribose pyrophosphatase